MTVFLIIVVILGLSLAGGLAPRLFSGRLSDRAMHDITGLASGLLLASAFLVVIPEGFHLAAESAAESASDEAFSSSPITLGAMILAGFVAMLLLEGFGVSHAVLDDGQGEHIHHHHHNDHVHHHGADGGSVTVLAVGLSVHAMADGLAIGSALVAGEAAFSYLVAAAVLLHRVPAAFSLGLFAQNATGTDRSGGRSADLWAVVGFSVATPIVIMIVYLILDSASESLTALALLFSAGTFVYVATVDTLPAVHHPTVGRRSVLAVLFGAALFALVLLVFDAAGAADHAH